MRIVSYSQVIMHTFQVIDVIKASTADLGPLSLDSLRKNNLSASWKFVGQEIIAKESAADAKVWMKVRLSLGFCN